MIIVVEHRTSHKVIAGVIHDHYGIHIMKIQTRQGVINLLRFRRSFFAQRISRVFPFAGGNFVDQKLAQPVETIGVLRRVVWFQTVIPGGQVTSAYRTVIYVCPRPGGNQAGKIVFRATVIRKSGISKG